MKSLPGIVAVCVAAVLSFGCATYGGTHLVPGKSTAAEVEATMGPPSEKFSEAGGNTIWMYSRLPYGRETFAVRIDANGIVRDVEQRLTQENVRKIIPGKSTMQDVRALMGPPSAASYFQRQQYTSWEYPMIPGGVTSWMILWVQFSDDGIAREVLYMDDPAKHHVNGGADSWN